jgi:hypothetical protein
MRRPREEPEHRPVSYVFMNGIVGGTVEIGGVDLLMIDRSCFEQMPVLKGIGRLIMTGNSFGRTLDVDDYGIEWVR